MTAVFKREIRSFVCRNSRMTHTQKQALQELMSMYSIALENYTADKPICFDQVFGREAPTIVEIGCGAGEALLAMAKEMPDKNFLGIEVYLPGIGSLLSALSRAAISNVRIVNLDAGVFFGNYIAAESFASVYIFFPDPWPKRRHHKRRLIQPDFVKLLRQKMKRNAILHIATDSDQYAEWILKVVTQNLGFHNVVGDKLYSIRPEWRPITRFERKGLLQKNLIRELVFQRQ